MSRIPKLFIALVVVTLVSGVATLAEIRGHSEIKTKRIEAITMMKTKTMCVGRLMIDVPGDAVVSYANAEIAGWAINTTVEETDEAFALRLIELERKARAGDELEKRAGLESVIPIDDGQRKGKIFVFGRESDETVEDGKLSKLVWMSMHALFRLEGISYQISSDLARESDLPELRRMVAQLQHRENEQIPETPGICLNRAVLADPIPPAGAERTRLTLELPGKPDAALVLASFGRVLVEPGLLERSARSDVKRKYASRFHFLRQQKRRIAEWVGDEQVRRVHELNGVTVRSAFWEFAGSKSDILKPHISLEFRTGLARDGEPINSSFSDDELLAWWDRVSSTLRIRSRYGEPIPN